MNSMGSIPEIYPCFEVMGQWEDPTTKRLKFWVRLFCADSQGKQIGTDVVDRFFDSLDILAFTCARERRSALAIEPQRPLTLEELEGVAEILRARTVSSAGPASFVRLCKRALATVRRKAGGLDGRTVLPVDLAQVAQRDGLLLLKGKPI
jgi:hypothetical protein